MRQSQKVFSSKNHYQPIAVDLSKQKALDKSLKKKH